MRAIRYNGSILTFSGKILRMAEWVYQEGIHYLRVLAGGGVTKDRNLTEDIYKMEEEHSFPPTLVGVLPESGRVERASGIYRFASRLFNLGAGVKYNATQLVTNGNFANGTTGWTAENGSTNTLVSGNLVNTGGSTSAIPRATRDYLPNTLFIGNKYYLFSRQRVLNASCTSIILQADQSGITANSLQTVTTPIQNTWYILSGIFTATYAGGLGIRHLHIYPDAATANGKQMEIDYSAAINLTATFGAGNEPSKEVCDVIFADYFDGTKEVQLNDVIQSTANSQPYIFKKGIKNPTGGGRLMKHPTVSFAANEAWSASCLLKPNGIFSGNWDVIAGHSTANNRRIMLIGSGLYVANSSGDYFINNFDLTSKIIGKSILLTIVCDGTSNWILYLNGIQVTSGTGVSTGFDISSLFNYPTDTTTRRFNGDINYYFVRSGALTPEQITAEYNLLSSYFPEISTVQVGSKHIATDNCEMVRTPKGNVIALNNLAANTEIITNAADREFSSDTGFWTKGANTTISGGLLVINGASSGVRAITRNGLTTANRIYKIRFTVSGYGSGNVGVSDNNLFSQLVGVNGNGTYTWYMQISNTTVALYVSGTTTLNIDNVSVEDVGFAGAADLYTAIYNQTSGTNDQKHYAALKAAAMWRSPDSDLDKQAVFGKLYNGYAAKLLALDIAAYNTENPSDPWGYDIIEEADLVELGTDPDALKDTEYWSLGTGTNVTGFSAYPAGVILTDGNYMGFGDVAAFWTKDSPLDLRLGASIRLKKV